jgi:hypothetical protein
MSSAVQAAGGPATVDIVQVAHSYVALLGVAHDIAARQTSLETAGIDPVAWYPDPASNTVRVELRGYSAGVAEDLSNLYPGLVTVVPAVATLPSRFSNRYFDTSPFFGGDRVLFNGNFAPNATHCTDDFTVIGNRSGATYGVTAGHCGGSSVWTNFNSHYELGPVVTNYFSATSGWDMESFSCSSCAGGYVWYDPPSAGASTPGVSHGVLGPCSSCGVGQLVTTDGATIGETPDNYVDETNVCQEFNDGITTCNLDYAYNTNGEQICEAGDSGGPVYQRTSNDNVYAAGLIVGGYSVDDCYYEDMNLMLNKLNSHLWTTG